jgi:hypothetical protein
LSTLTKIYFGTSISDMRLPTLFQEYCAHSYSTSLFFTPLECLSSDIRLADRGGECQRSGSGGCGCDGDSGACQGCGDGYLNAKS